MRRELDKIKRVKPVIKAREARVQQEAEILSEIRGRKIHIVAAMKERQKKYMDGVEELNRQRCAALRGNLEMLEQGLDYVKNQWYQLFQEVQAIEKREKAQIAQLQAAEGDMRAIVKLSEHYQTQFQKSVAKNEQRQIDEFGLRKFIGN